MSVDLKTADQAGAVYGIVPKARQKAALAFLSDNILATPTWLQPREIVSRLGPSTVLSARQGAMVTSLLSAARLSRMAESEKYDPANAYPLAEYLADLKRAAWSDAAPDANRRHLQRVYLQRLEALVAPPAPASAAAPGAGGGGGGGAPPRPAPFVTPATLVLSDLPAMARMQLRDIQRDARVRANGTADVTARAHWNDVADRITQILEPKH